MQQFTRTPWRCSVQQQVRRFRDYVLCACALGSDPRSVGAILWRETKNMRVRLGVGSYNPTGVYSLRTIYGPLYFRDNFGDITNLVGIFYHQVYGRGPLDGEGAILDIGANIGLAAAWFGYHNPEGPSTASSRWPPMPP